MAVMTFGRRGEPQYQSQGLPHGVDRAGPGGGCRHAARSGEAVQVYLGRWDGGERSGRGFAGRGSRRRRGRTRQGVAGRVRGFAGGLGREDWRIEGLDMDGNSAQSFDPDRHLPTTQRRSRLAATPQARDCALANRTPFTHCPYALTGSTALRPAIQ